MDELMELFYLRKPKIDIINYEFKFQLIMFFTKQVPNSDLECESPSSLPPPVNYTELVIN